MSTNITIICRTKLPNFPWYQQEIHLINVTEDDKFYYGKPVRLTCCQHHKDPNEFGIIGYPKRSWKVK